jgi:hypothetical protein
VSSIPVVAAVVDAVPCAQDELFGPVFPVCASVFVTGGAEPAGFGLRAALSARFAHSALALASRIEAL